MKSLTYVSDRYHSHFAIVGTDTLSLDAGIPLEAFN
jgi:hypothetical protein